MDYLEISEQIKREFTCACEETALRYVVCSNGVRQYKRQCLRCGTTGSPLAVRLLPPAEVAQALEVDRDLRDDWFARMTARREALRAEALAEQRAEYSEYLLSPWWRARRALKLARQPWCEAELPGCQGRAVEVHHATYDRKTREPLFDLRSVCAACHRVIHGGSDV